MKSIPLTKGKFALVDDEDYPRLIKFNWHCHPHGYAHSHVRVSRNNYKSIKMHRVILGAKRNQLVDHKDQNRLNNQRANLRFCNKGQNRANSKLNAGRRYRGVYRRRDGWDVYVRKGKTHFGGHYKDEHIAALMADFWITFFHGDFAATNFTVVSHS